MDFGDRLRYRRFGTQTPQTPPVPVDPELWAGAAILAMDWDALIPAGPEKDAAMAKLEEALSWANAAIKLQH
jgi:hypothetical protein